MYVPLKALLENHKFNSNYYRYHCNSKFIPMEDRNARY